MTKEKQYTMSEEMFSDVIIQVGILKETYDKIGVNREMNSFQKKVLTKNKKANLDLLDKLEKMCD